MPDMLPDGTTVIENPPPKPEAPAGYPYLRRKDADIFYIWTPGFATSGNMLPATAAEYREWAARQPNAVQPQVPVALPVAAALPVAPPPQTQCPPGALVCTCAQTLGKGCMIHGVLPAWPPTLSATATSDGLPPAPVIGKCIHDVPFDIFCASCKALGKPTAAPAALPSQSKAKAMNATKLHALVQAVTGCPAGAEMSRKDMLNILYNDGKPPEPKV